MAYLDELALRLENEKKLEIISVFFSCIFGNYAIITKYM